MIRKISIGVDLLKAMHYQVGQQVINSTHEITDIIADEHGVKVWIINKNNERVCWKFINNHVPVTIEYSLEF